jgi:GTP pyrophosphokinase
VADAPTSSPVDLGGGEPGQAVAPPEPQPAPPNLTAGPPTSRRVRARLARLGAQRHGTNPVLEPLFRVVRQTHPKADLRVLEQAYDIAEHHHRGQVRKSGDPFITHPLAVTTILAELGMTPPTLCASLLHDTVEDTPYTLETLRADFGDEVAHLVDGVTKLDRVTYGESAQAETVRKMVVAMAKDFWFLGGTKQGLNEMKLHALNGISSVFVPVWLGFDMDGTHLLSPHQYIANSIHLMMCHRIKWK